MGITSLRNTHEEKKHFQKVEENASKLTFMWFRQYSKV